MAFGDRSSGTEGTDLTTPFTTDRTPVRERDQPSRPLMRLGDQIVGGRRPSAVDHRG
jgi:hypothetical protein